jgi:predicted small metal-binding protein
MAKILHCKDLGMECDYVVRGETVEGVMALAGEHAKSAHGMTDADMTPEMVEKVKAAIKDE